jgi:hypothetical protein
MNNKMHVSLAVILLLVSSFAAKSQTTSTGNDLLFSKNNLLAWCVVPYDSKKRNAEERAAMLNDLGITSFVYDWRAQDLPNMEHEFATLKKYNIALKGIWFWVNGSKDHLLDEANETILKTLAKTNTKTVLWLSFPNKYFESLPDEQKIQKAAKTIQYIHQRKDVGIIYNFHHGHAQVDDFDNILKVTKPYLQTVNLNGMKGNEFNILPLGEGDHELALMKKLKASGFNGSIGIIGHTENEDVKVVLERNLAGLKKLLAQMGETQALRTYQ